MHGYWKNKKEDIMAKEKQKIKIVCTECKGNGYIIVYQSPHHENCPTCDQQGEILINESQLQTIYAGADVISH